MKENYTNYFLYTENQRKAFIAVNSAMIKKNRSAYIKWINSLPIGRKVSYLDNVKENERCFIIGLLCLLYCEEQINISFHEEGRLLSREPRSPKEYSQWMQEYGFKKGKNKKIE